LRFEWPRAPIPFNYTDVEVSVVAKAKKGNRIKIIVQCTEFKEAGVPPSRYSTFKNRKNTPARLEIKKYNPWMRKHTVHKEIK